MMGEHRQCSAGVWGESYFRKYPCSRNATYNEIDKWWCWQHAPSRLAEREAKKEAQYKCDAAFARAARQPEPPVGHWTRIEDGLPDYYREVLVYSGDYGGPCIEVGIFQEGDSKKPDAWIDDTLDNHPLTGVTHWMPLPEGPTT